MRKLPPLHLLCAGTAGLMLAGCVDYTTGQDQEPAGPLLVTRLTLFDMVSRDHVIFTDTSVPDCDKAENATSKTCTAEPVRDAYTPSKAVPTPDSGREMRVVFNKVPLLYGNKQLEAILRDPDGGAAATPMPRLVEPDVVGLACTDCTAVPPLANTLIISGADTTSDPTFPGGGISAIPYGPAILSKVTADATHSRAALEPGTTYTVTIKPELSGRVVGDKLSLDAKAMGLLRFTTEPFKALRLVADPKAKDGGGKTVGDQWIYDGGAAFDVGTLPANGVIAVTLNAAAFTGNLAAAVTANAGSAVTPQVTVQRLVKPATGNAACTAGNGRTIYIAPPAAGWGTTGKLTVTIKGASLSDVSQAAHAVDGDPAIGKHQLPELTLTATLTMAADPKTYTGLVRGTDCPKPANL